jgi:GGDEF domain-containing protein
MSYWASYKLVLVGLVISLLAYLAYPLIPERRLSLLPDLSAQIRLQADKVRGGNSQVFWRDQGQRLMACDIKPGRVNPFCGMHLPLGNGRDKGINLQSFSAVKLRAAYKGPGQSLRFNLRVFDPRFSQVELPESAKFESFVFFADANLRDIEVSFRDIQVAEWWLRDFATQRALAGVDFRNVVQIGIDIPGAVAPGLHEIRVDALELVGVWVTPEQWYRGILLAWVLAGLAWVSWDAYLRFRRQRVDRLRLAEFSKSYRRLAAHNLHSPYFSFRDPVTQALDRTGLCMALWELEHRLPKPRMQLAVLVMADWPKLKQQLAAEALDSLLAAFSQSQQDFAGDDDLVARWSEDTFIWLSTEPQEQLLNHLRCLKLHLQAVPFELGDKSQSLRFSALLEHVSDMQALPQRLGWLIEQGHWHNQNGSYSVLIAGADEAAGGARPGRLGAAL